MLVGEIAQTAILAIAGFVLFVLVIRFHAPHALLLGPLTVVLVAFTAAMAMDSLRAGPRANLRERPIPPQQRTIRKSASSTAEMPVEKKVDPAKKKTARPGEQAPSATRARPDF
jgi:hypothetical protein